jgi:hypothetical protein
VQKKCPANLFSACEIVHKNNPPSCAKINFERYFLLVKTGSEIFIPYAKI